MCKKQVRLLKWEYMINAKENETEMKNRSSRYDIKRPRRWHGCKYTKYKLRVHIMMVKFIREYLSYI